jgi:endonuclease/exonuclease/phosphatase (EEP) superfamily protein YafD
VRARVVVFWVVVALLGLPALLLTLTRALEPHGGFWLKVEAFTTLGLLLYAVALVVLVVRLVLLRRLRSATTVAALVAVAGLVVHGWWFAPQVTGANPPPAEGADPVVVMSVNLRIGGADGVDVVSDASKEGVDLLVVQEVTAAALADMDRAGLRDLLPYRVGALGDGPTGTMAFSSTRLSDPEPLPITFGSWSFRMGDLTVIGLHTTTPNHPSRWYDDHAVVARAVERLAPDLVVGDFNATNDHAPMRALADDGYRDAGELANDGWQPTWPTSGVFDVIGSPVAQIDHVLVGPDLAAVSMTTVGVPGSDHRAVVATVAEK